jgi:hypothetical protein
VQRALRIDDSGELDAFMCTVKTTRAVTITHILQNSGAGCREALLRYMIVNGTLDEVSLIVLPPPPYGPPGVLLPGLVTVTITVPAVATAEAGIATVS